MTDTLPPPGSLESERVSSKDRSKRGSKLKYLKYSPPSSAGPEPGAWRQAIGQAPPTTGGRRISPDSSDLDFISLSLDVANVSLDFKDPSSPGARVNWNSNPKGKNGKRKKKGGGGGGGRTGNSSAPTPSEPLVFNGNWTRRSTSNRLLNCFTIDDCMARYRNRLALGHGGPEAWTTAKAELAYTLDTFPNPKHPMEDLPQTDGHKANGVTPGKSFPNGGGTGGSSRGSSARRTNRETSFGETYLGSDDSSMPLNNDNEALAKAMHTILTSTEVVNNTARTGLFPKSKRQRRTKLHQRHHPEQQHQQNQQERPVSTRFRRMNDALHKWIDDEIILPRSRLGSMNSLRSQSQDDGVENGAGGDEGAYSPNNHHQRHTTSTPQSDRYRGPRSMDAPVEVLRRKPDASSRLRDPTRRPRSAEDNADNAANDLHRGPHRSDSFLEMLMELDEDKRGPDGDDGGGLTTVADTETLDGSART